MSNFVKFTTDGGFQNIPYNHKEKEHQQKYTLDDVFQRYVHDTPTSNNNNNKQLVVSQGTNSINSLLPPPKLSTNDYTGKPQPNRFKSTSTPQRYSSRSSSTPYKSKCLSDYKVIQTRDSTPTRFLRVFGFSEEYQQDILDLLRDRGHILTVTVNGSNFLTVEYESVRDAKRSLLDLDGYHFNTHIVLGAIYVEGLNHDAVSVSSSDPSNSTSTCHSAQRIQSNHSKAPKPRYWYNIF